MTGLLEGKVAFITGAARGQGRSHAVRLAQEGADIIAVDLCAQVETVGYPMATPEDLAETVAQVEALDRRIVATQVDVRDRAALQAAFDAGVAELGGVDIVLGNAGIAALSLNADLVVLSACNTASPNGRPGADGLSGLARAFIAAGARGLVVSHWRVASAATASLIERFGVGLAAGTPPAQALRTAMLGELVKGGDSAHPALWAPFFVVGAGG